MSTSDPLNKIRAKLIRLEETIIFALIERAQFRCNLATYSQATASPGTGGRCLFDYVLAETERAHARVGRFRDRIEVPFFAGLPEPAAAPEIPEEIRIQANGVNLNPKLRAVYAGEIVPYLCLPGDDGNHWESCAADTHCLQAVSRRIHYGKVVAEVKYREHRDEYTVLVAGGRREELLERITDKAVEARVLERIGIKASHYGQDPSQDVRSAGRIDPGAVVAAYRQWIIPLTKEVELDYLFEVAAREAAAP